MLTKEFLLQKKTEYLQAAEQNKLNAIANAGAADAIDAVIAEMDKEAATVTTDAVINKE